jgi:predicted RecB family nuclease
MPKLYVYFGLVVFFYANEHEPIHVHGECQGRECRAEFVLKEGRVVRIVFRQVTGRPALTGVHLKDFKALVRAKTDDIVQRWVDFFVLKKHITPQVITRRLK